MAWSGVAHARVPGVRRAHGRRRRRRAGCRRARQRRLVAMLLIHRNEVVSVDRLAEAVFAGEPTPGAATTLRSHVARLRRVVDREGSGSRVVTRAPGYMLEVADEAFDVARFEALVAEGRSQLAQGDAVAASTALRSASALCPPTTRASSRSGTRPPGARQPASPGTQEESWTWPSRRTAPRSRPPAPTAPSGSGTPSRAHRTSCSPATETRHPRRLQP